LRAAHAGIEWQLQPAVGEADAVVEAMAQVALARLGAGGNGPAMK
jgi:hypothetical protein